MQIAIIIDYNPPALSFTDFHQIDVEYFPDEPVDLPTLQAFLKRDILGAWDAGLLVGYCYCQRKPGPTEQKRIGVTSSRRWQGIGRSLMERVVDLSIRIGMPKIMLFVQDDNLPAVRLFEA